MFDLVDGHDRNLDLLQCQDDILGGAANAWQNIVFKIAWAGRRLAREAIRLVNFLAVHACSFSSSPALLQGGLNPFSKSPKLNLLWAGSEVRFRLEPKLA
jgi:hypothetical protein